MADVIDMDTIGWGILGPGNIVRRFMNDLPRCKGVKLAAVGSRSANKAKEFADQYHFEKSWGSYEELIRDESVDIIYVATPHPFHREQAILCMEAGKAVLCEKPVAVNASQTREMVECARKNNVFFMEGMWTRHFPVKEIIDSGVLGQVTLIQADFGFGRWDHGKVSNSSGRLYAPELAGGSLLDVGVYCVSFASYITGMQPSKIEAISTMVETGVDGMTVCLFQYENGGAAMLQSSIVQSTRQTAMIYCEHGAIEIPNFWNPSRAIIQYNQPSVRREVIEIPFNDDGATGFNFEVEEAMNCLRVGLKESPRMTWQESIDVMRTMDRIRGKIGLRYAFED